MSRNADDFLGRHPDLLEADWRRPGVARFVAALMAPFALYFRFRGGGLEHVPASGCLVVANHNNGALWEILLLHRWWHRSMPGRSMRGLQHRIAFELPLKLLPVGQWIGGALAHPEVARRILEKGDALLVFPGGDYDSCRPFRDRYKVVFGGRTGFVRTARAAGVPIVPLALTGAHVCYLTPFDTRRLAKLLRLEKRGLKAFPLSLGMLLFFAAAIAALVEHALWPLALGAFVQMCLPLPTRIEAEVLEPIVPGAEETDEQVAERVRLALEAAMGRAAARRITPWG